MLAKQMMHLRTGKGLVGLQQAVDAHLDSDSEDLAQQKAAHYVFIDSLDHLLQHAALAEASLTNCSRLNVTVDAALYMKVLTWLADVHR